MDIDPRVFFETPPLMDEALKAHVRELGQQVARGLLGVLRLYALDDVRASHVKLAVSHIALDPVLAYDSAQGLLVQATNMRSTPRIVCKAIDEALAMLEQGDRHGGLDRRVVHAVVAQAEAANVALHASGKIAIACCVSEVCGMLLQTAARQLEGDAPTLTLEAFREHSLQYRMHSGETATNSSLLRFLSFACARREWADAWREPALQDNAAPSPTDRHTGAPSSQRGILVRSTQRGVTRPRKKPSSAAQDRQAVRFHADPVVSAARRG